MQSDDRSHPTLTPAQREVEDALRGLAPAPSRIDRDRLLFEAGAVEGRRQSNALRWAVGALAAGLALALLLRPEPTVVERVVSRPPTSTPVLKQADADPKVDDFPEPSPGALAGASRLPIPVPGGPFVTMPPGYVSVASFQPGGDTRTSAYVGAIRGVLARGLDAIPGAQTWRRGPADDSARDAASQQGTVPATDESPGR